MKKRSLLFSTTAVSVALLLSPKAHADAVVSFDSVELVFPGDWSLEKKKNDYFVTSSDGQTATLIALETPMGLPAERSLQQINAIDRWVEWLFDAPNRPQEAIVYAPRTTAQIAEGAVYDEMVYGPHSAPSRSIAIFGLRRRGTVVVLMAIYETPVSRSQLEFLRAVVQGAKWK
jgi:hypothetical protein